jgi:L-xylulokinase
VRLAVKRYLMGIDCGGTYSKAVIFDAQGREVGLARAQVSMLTPEPGFTERNLEEFWASVKKAISRALETSGIHSEDIAAIGVTGHGKGLYMIDEKGMPAADGIVSTDSRCMEQLGQLYQSGMFEDLVYPRAMQQIWPGHTAPIMAWIKKNRKDIWARTAWFLTCKDYIRFRLTASVAIERTDLSGTGFYNNRLREIDDELLKAFGIEDVRERIPRIIEATDVAGYVNARIAAETGLKEGTPVAGGLFDVNASAVAMQVMEEDDFAAVIGTWSISEYITRDISAIEKQKDHYVVQAHCLPEYWMVHEASPTSCSNYEWFLDKILAPLPGGQGVGKNYEEINLEVGRRIDTASYTLFLPYIFGNNLSNEARAGFFNLSAMDDSVSMIRAIYEGVAFTHKSHIDKLLKVRSRPEVIRFAGGAVHSDVWMGIFADILETPVEIDKVGELTALGAAMTAGVAVGFYKDYRAAMAALEKNKYLITPVESRKDYYRNKYGEYKRLIEALSNGYWNRK